MPIFIIGSAVIGLGTTLYANKKRKDAAEDAIAAMEAEAQAREQEIQDALAALDRLESGEINIPFEKPEVAPMIEVEKGKIGDNYFDALDTAKSDASIEEQVKQSEKALSAQLDISDPRIKAAVGRKAVDEFNDKQAEIQAQGKEDIMKAQMAVGEAQTRNELDFVGRTQQAELDYTNRLQSAENMYAQQLNTYMQGEYDRLNNIIGEQQEQVYGLDYGSATTMSQTQAQNAADFASTTNQLAGAAMPYMNKGGKAPKSYEQGGMRRQNDFLEFLQRTSDRDVDALVKGIKARGEMEAEDEDTFKKNGGRFSFEQGGAAAMTRGEFNHGDPNRPETGNDQILLDQEDLKAVMDNGGANSFDELMSAVPPQAVTTGGELIFNDKDSSNIESLTDATDPTSAMEYARKGRKVKKKKSPAEIRKAEAALAAYMRNLLSKEQFQA